MIVIASILVLLVSNVQSANVVLKPLAGKSGTPVGLVFIQGVYAKPELYIPVCEAIQHVFSRPLYVGIPEFVGDLPNPAQFEFAVSSSMSDLEKAGLPKTASYFLGSHSGGGIVLAASNGNFSKNVKGQFLFGSYIPRFNRNPGSTKQHFTYRLPTLTVSGSLDGLTRVSRIAEEFYVQITRESLNRGYSQGQFDEAVVSNFPVVVVEGMTHWQVASGKAPSRVLQYDLQPEISQAEAYSSLAHITSAFMAVQLGDGSKFAEVEQAVSQTADFVSPIIQSMLLEGSYHFEDPCYCSDTICKPSSKCIAGSKWTQIVSSPTMAGVGNDEKVSFTDIDSFHRVYTVTPVPPFVHEPSLKGSCKLTDSKCNLTMVTISQNVYEQEKDPIQNDDGLVRTGAVEIRTKMISRQKVFRARGYDTSRTSFTTTDGGNNCGNINQIAIDYAMRNADSKTVARYKQFGEQLRIGKDIEHGDGPQWIWIPLNFTEVTTGTEKYMLVTSNSMKTCEKCLAPGYHYCKVLSPVWVMDWLYTDSLRWKRGIHQA